MTQPNPAERPAVRRLRAVPRDEVLAAFASAPLIDADTFRADLDASVDGDPFGREW